MWSVWGSWKRQHLLTNANTLCIQPPRPMPSAWQTERLFAFTSWPFPASLSLSASLLFSVLSKCHFTAISTLINFYYLQHCCWLVSLPQWRVLVAFLLLLAQHVLLLRFAFRSQLVANLIAYFSALSCQAMRTKWEKQFKAEQNKYKHYTNTAAHENNSNQCSITAKFHSQTKRGNFFAFVGGLQPPQQPRQWRKSAVLCCVFSPALGATIACYNKNKSKVPPQSAWWRVGCCALPDAEVSPTMFVIPFLQFLDFTTLSWASSRRY